MIKMLKFALVGCFLSVSCSSWGALAPSSNTVPGNAAYLDTFEVYPNGTPLIGGTNGWYADFPDVIAQNAEKRSGQLAAMIPFDCFLSNRFENVVSNVWMTMWVRAIRFDGANYPIAKTNASTVFYVNNNGNFLVKTGAVGSAWSALTNTARGDAYSVTDGEWMRLDVHQDYSKKSWKLFSDYVLINDALPFVNTNIARFNGFDLYNGGSTTYLDNVEVSYSIPGELVQHGSNWLPYLQATTNLILQATNEEFNAASQEVGIYRESGFYGLTYTSSVTLGADWLSINVTNGSSSGETNIVGLSYNTAGLGRGVHMGRVTVVGRATEFDKVGSLNSPMNIDVEMTINHPLPSIALSSIQGVTIKRGENAPSTPLYVWNGNSNYVLRYKASREAAYPWIAIGTPSVGISTGQQRTVTISFLTAGLDFGTHVGRVTMEGSDFEYGDAVTSQYAEVTVTVVGPTPPPTVNASDGTYRDRVAVNWPSATDAVNGYEVRRGITNNSATSLLLATVGSTNFIDTTCYAGQTYYYWVRSINPYGYAGDYSAPDTGYRGIVPPSVVRASDGTSTSSIFVSWSESLSATGYKVYRNTSTDYNAASVIATVAVTNIVDTPPGVGINYYYWVRCTNAFSASDFSIYDSGFRALSPPVSIAASDRTYTNKIDIVWSVVSNATIYEVWRNTLDNPASAGKIAETVSPIYVDLDCASEVDYYYWVSAKNGIARSVLSLSDVGRRKSVSTAFAPNWITASDGVYTNRVRVTWSAAIDAATYEVWRSLQNTSESAALLGQTAAMLFDDASVTGGMTYFYWVKGVNPNGSSDFSPCDSGYGAIVGSTNCDLAVTNLIFLPAACAPLGNPGHVSIRLKNNGPSPMAGNNRRVTLDFYCTTNSALDQPGYLWLGNVEMDLTMAINESKLLRLSSSALDGLIMPAAVGEYNVFARIHHTYPSTLQDPVSANNMASRIAPVKVNVNGGSPYRQVNDYTGDNTSDFAVYNEATGCWFIFNMYSGLVAWNLPWGGEGFVPVSGDYDNDGRGDMAVYRSETACWFIISATGSVIAWNKYWGGAGFAPVSGDFDGDGRSDMAVYQESTGNWFIQTVKGRVLAWLENWGGAGMVPVSGDFLGDGASTMAVYSKSGYWFIRETQKKSVLAWQKSWGYYNMIPVNGDYNGDGIADMAVYDTSTGYWYVRSLSGNLMLWAWSWGGPDFTPVSGDYNGDGVSDLAVYHLATGNWYVWSLDGRVLAWDVNWGGPGLSPVR